MIRTPLPDVVPAAINHLLSQDSAARSRLLAHAGKVARFDLGLLALSLRVDSDGMVASANADAAAHVTIRIKPADLPLILQQRDRAFSFVTIDGDADFANTISQLSQSTRWDAEADLSRIVGDIAAVRLMSGSRAVLQTIDATGRKFAETTAEYFLEENPLLMRPQPIRDFADDVARLRDDVERLAKRITRLKDSTR